MRLAVASPFWDSGAAIDRLCRALGLSEVFVHSHPDGAVEGTAGSNWPLNSSSVVHAVAIDGLRDEKADTDASLRRLHAKVFEVVCRRGRLLISGSANATRAALDVGHNVEACIARIQRERLVGWSMASVSPPEPRFVTDEVDDVSEQAAGVLRATLSGDWIAGQVLSPPMTGEALAFKVTSRGREPLGEVKVDADGNFGVAAPGLELESWKGGRLVLRIESGAGRFAEGFVSVAAFSEIVRRAGHAAPRLLALLAGTEAPPDVLAIISWLQEDPTRLTTAGADISGGTPAEPSSTPAGALVQVNQLNSLYTVQSRPHGQTAPAAGSGWARFMSHLFAALREPRGPLALTTSGRPGDDDDEMFDPGAPAPPDPAIERAFAVLDRLIDDFLSPRNASTLAMTAFDLTQYVCERLTPNPAVARDWLEKLLDALCNGASPNDRAGDVAAATLLGLAMGYDPGGPRRARDRLLRLGYDLAGPPPDMGGVRGFQTVMVPIQEMIAVWSAVQGETTATEQVRSYLTALRARQPSAAYGRLEAMAPDAWPILVEAVTSDRARKHILIAPTATNACPACHSVLPASEIHKLHHIRVAVALNCCGRIIIQEGA